MPPLFPMDGQNRLYGLYGQYGQKVNGKRKKGINPQASTKASGGSRQGSVGNGSKPFWVIYSVEQAFRLIQGQVLALYKGKDLG